MFKSLTKSFIGTTASPRISPTVVGGAANLDQLLDKLANDTSVSDKIKAAELIRASIETQVVSSIPEIWYSARDMIASHNAPECRRAGLRLMNACIAHDEHAIGSRIMYYKTLVKHSNLVDFDLQLKALKTLTKDGRDLLDLNRSGYPLPYVLASWLRRLAIEAQEIRVGRKRDETAGFGVSMDENFHDLLRFTINTLKFNMAAYEEKDLDTLLKEAVTISRKTSEQEDVALSCELINTVMVYGIMPVGSLSSVLEILCGISITVDSLVDKTWEIVVNLSKSHLGNSTVADLCEILQATSRKEVNSNTMRGAARFLKRLVELYGVPNKGAAEGGTSLEISLPAVFAAYLASLDVESARHSLEICNCVYELLSDEGTRKLITYELWESTEYSPLEIVFHISQMTVVQQAAASVNGSKRLEDQSMGTHAVGDPGDTALKIIGVFQKLLNLLSDLMVDDFQGPKESIVNFLFDMTDFLNERAVITIIDHFAKFHYCSPLTVSWRENLDTLLNTFFFNLEWSPRVRLKIIDIFRDVYTMSGREIKEMEQFEEITKRVFSVLDLDKLDAETTEYLVRCFVYIGRDCWFKLFADMSDLLMKQFPSETSNTKNPPSAVAVERRRLIATGMGELFTKVFRSLSRRARYLFYNLLTVTQRSRHEPHAFVEAARPLCRIRANASNYIYMSSPTIIAEIAGRFGRTNMEEDVANGSKKAWYYPDTVPYLKEKYMNRASPVLKRSGWMTMEASNLRDREYVIDPAILLDAIANIIETGADWEVYSFTIVHAFAQLSNLQLFQGCRGEIQRLRKVLCEQISSSKLPQSLVLPDNVNRLDVISVEIQMLSNLIAFTDVFTKTDYDYIVQALVLALSSWERTAVACIHALTICCYECPLSLKKYLGQIFAKFQTKITTIHSSPHILEFLWSLSRLPWLTDNFTQEEFKRVFGMAFTYIQHANDLVHKAGQSDRAEDRVMSQYLLALAYSTIASWFLAIKLSNRQHIATYIVRNLILADGKLESIDEQSLATLDLITHFTQSDLDLFLQPSGLVPAPDRKVKRWIYGSSVIAFETDEQTGESRFLVRRPTGMGIFDIKPDARMYPPWLTQLLSQGQAGDDEKAARQVRDAVFSPSYLLLQMVVPNDVRSTFKPLPLPDDPQTVRAISALDRAPVVDFHKIGIMYIGPGQSDERDILANAAGSRAYRVFLSQIGTLIRLKGNRRIYTGGLDTEMDMDGEYAYAWNDKIAQMIFHTTTLMPTREGDTSVAGKKRHVGNNYVNIFYDESGLPFRFDTVPSQFNFINIVISPHAYTAVPAVNGGDAPGEPSAHLASQPPGENQELLESGVPDGLSSAPRTQFYSVQTYRRPGVPDIFVAGELTIVSESNLAVFVRNLALVASKFATVYHSEGQYISNWRYRLQQIKTLEERVLAQRAGDEEKTAQADAEKERGGEHDLAASFMGQLAGVTATNSDSDSTPSVGPVSGVTFVAEPDNGVALPLLRSLDFNKFA